jgi:type IV secretion system protein VirB9
MKHATFFTAALLALACAGAAHADSRIRELPYRANNVVLLESCLGLQTMIEFAPDERIENVGVGDAGQWLAVPNTRANLLFVRPTLASTHSNMTVATSKRRYAFELSAKPSAECARGDAVYYLRFRYSDLTPTATQNQAAPTAPEKRNEAYSYSGAEKNVPSRVFDDGRATYFRWPRGSTTPAVFVRGPDGSETLANFAGRGEFLVTDQVAPCFLLRNGEATTVLYNDAFVAPTLDDGSPRSRGKEKNHSKSICGKDKPRAQ